MSENSAILHFDDIVKSEYEIQLYGFSLNQFAEENIYFVESEMKESMVSLKNKLFETIKDLNPELSDNISKVTDEVFEDILKEAVEGVTEINNFIAEKLKIPENVLLYVDHAQARKVTKEQNEELEKEIEQLEKQLKENAFFIHALNEELSTYDGLEENFLRNEEINRFADEQLDCILGTSVSLNMLNKIKDL